MIWEDTQYEVKVLDAFKSYGGNNVLNGLNMEVPSCTIYGLLGPSGCGKSTLLQCILGTITLNSGSIDLKVESLKDIGYMPQDLCLEETLTIRETFEYYGALYNMSKKKIGNRIEELNKFLQLPNLHSLINTISGGQSRRVSFAVSILHDPKCIILDEPTVGIDPLLREKIWDEFTRMVKQYKKTIIITTHYIEEANRADCVGLMRNGLLIEEGSLQEILTKYSTVTLEAAFLTSCCNQKIIENTHYKVRVKDKIKTTKNKDVMKLGNSIDFYRIKALLKKNFYVFSRDYLLLFTMVLLPILQSFNFSLGIGVKFKNMPIAVKNDEISFSDCQDINVNECIFDKNSNQKMSCFVMNYLAIHNYILIEVNNRETGEIKMNNRNYMAFIYFPKNYTIDLIKYIDDRKHFDMDFRAYVHLTKENMLFRNQILTDLLSSIHNLMKTILIGCSSNSKTISIPMEFNILFGNEVKSYANSIVTLFIAMLAFYFPSVFSVSIMMSEKMDGLFSRSMFAGVKILELVIALFCMSTIMFLAQIISIGFILYVLFLNPIQITNGLFVYMLILLLLGCIGFFFGLLTAILSPTKQGGVYIITGSCITQFILSGTIWPLEGQPEFLRNLSELLPMRLVGNMMNNIALKGWTLDHPSIKIGTSMTIVYTVLLVFVVIILGTLRKDLWVGRKK